MTNILFIYYNIEPTNEMVGDFLEKMSISHDISVRRMRTVLVKAKDLEWADVLIAVRTQSVLEVDLMKKAAEMGAFTIEYIDDDFLSLDYYERKRPFHARAFKTSIIISDAILTSAKTLVEKARLISGNNKKKYAMVDTAIEEDELHPYRMVEDDRVRIVYYVNDGDPNPFNAVFLPLLEKLSEKYGNKLELTLFSVHPDISDFESEIKISYLNRMPLTEFRSYLAGNNFSFGIAPLCNNEFSKSKYVNKFMEYTRAGIPCIYSDTEPYSSFINNGIDGILAENTDDSWMSAIEKVSDNDVKRNIVYNAQERIKNSFSPECIYQRIIKNIPELEHYKSSHVKRTTDAEIVLMHGKEKMIESIGFIYRIYVRIKDDGLEKTISWVQNHYFKMKQS